MEEIQTLQQINILGDATFSGQINVINDTNSTSYTTGSIVTAGGIGIAKDVFVNGTLNATKMHLIDSSGTTLGRQYFSNGTIWNIENQVGTGLTKSVDISQTGVIINQTTSASSTTTGALTVAGGISTQDNLWAKGRIVATDASSSTIIMTPSTPFGAVSSIQNGVIINNSSGFVNDASGNLLVGINTKHFGSRNTSNQGGIMKMSTTGTNLIDFSVLSAGSTGSADPISSLTIDQNGIVKVQTSTQSTTTTSGALQVTGGVGVEKNLNVGGTIALWDGLNSGTISQSGTNLNITATNINLTGNVSLKGNVQITGDVTLNGNTVGGGTSSSGVSTLDYKVLDDCILHSHVYNMANPSTTKTMLTSSYPLKDYSSNTAIVLTQNVLYFYAVHLIQGQVIKGVFFWSNSTNTTVRTGLYSPDGTLKASLNVAQSITGNNIKYLPLTNTIWTADSTGIYYVGILASSASTTIYGTPTNTYINYGATARTGKLTLAASSISSQSSMPSTLSGITPTALTQIAYVGVYKDDVPVNVSPITGMNSNTYKVGNTWIASASSFISEPYYAFDGNDTTYWHTAYPPTRYNNGVYVGGVSTSIVGVGNVAGEWLQIQFPSPFILREYTFKMRAIWQVRMPRVYYIVGSNNGTTWDVVEYKNYTGGPVGIVLTNSVSVTTPYSYYRLVINALYQNSGIYAADSAEILEWEMKAIV